MSESSLIFCRIPKDHRSKLDWELIKSYKSVNNTPKVVDTLINVLNRDPVINPMYFDEISSIIKELVDSDDFSSIVRLGLTFESNMRLVHVSVKLH